MKKLILILVFGFISCSPDDNNVPDSDCDNSTSEFQTLYQNMITSGHTDTVTYDTEIHEYTFELSTTEEVCGIGYQSQPGIATTPYVIEIVESNTTTIIYSGSHTFSDTATSYVTPTAIISLQAGTSYTIKRIQTNWGASIGNTIGRMATNNAMSFPYTNGSMTITSSKFHQNGGTAIDFGVPYIDIIFN
ncbi:hypothetical protein DHD32_21000 [Arenibacter sp. TNZ]|jgi:hypothetical protein|uniref:hypothetical protein n=1 Tax=Arenibacter TaxID=178469 RepID=UPI000CD414CF|nr:MULTISPECIES: hypothetical protein [Arenibacter]MCM4173952.1 hypothetical protein [Arenibacter sp. TNZ]